MFCMQYCQLTNGLQGQILYEFFDIFYTKKFQGCLCCSEKVYFPQFSQLNVMKRKFCFYRKKWKVMSICRSNPSCRAKPKLNTNKLSWMKFNTMENRNINPESRKLVSVQITVNEAIHSNFISNIHSDTGIAFFINFNQNFAHRSFLVN